MSTVVYYAWYLFQALENVVLILILHCFGFVMQMDYQNFRAAAQFHPSLLGGLCYWMVVVLYNIMCLY